VTLAGCFVRKFFCVIAFLYNVGAFSWVTMPLRSWRTCLPISYTSVQCCAPTLVSLVTATVLYGVLI
jgi:hypothetical protein